MIYEPIKYYSDTGFEDIDIRHEIRTYKVLQCW